MNMTRLFLTCTFVAMFGNSIQGNAEDIDLYSSAASVTGTDLPNVLFVWDNTASANASAPACTYADGTSPSLGATSQGIEQCALYNAVFSLPVQSNGTAVVNIGIMVYNAAGLSCSGVAGGNNGGCLVKALAPMNAAGKTSMLTFIKGLTAATIQSNNEATAQAMQESWAYFAGSTGMSGRTYASPVSGCAKNYVVFIGNAANNSGTPGDASASPDTALANTITANTALTPAQKTLLGAFIQIPSGAYGTSSFTCSPNPYTMASHTNAAAVTSGLYADEWARYMYSADFKTGKMPASKKIITYTIGVLSSSCKADYPALLTSMAIQGGGKYFPTGNAADIQQAILRVLNEVQAVNSVFSSASLPVSVNTQGTYLNQIFMGMFRPDAGGVPRWRGNLKQYQFGYNATTKQLFLADATGTAAISAAGTGFLSPDAASFWTCSNAANTTNQVTPYNVDPYKTSSTCSADPAVGFWANSPNGVSLAWDLPDGEVVEKGGAAQVMRLANIIDTYTTAPGSATNPRNLYTYCPSGAACGGSGTLLSAAPFDTSNAAITDALLGTGPIAINSITSAATTPLVSITAGTTGAPTTISITNFAKGAGSTVTATVASTASLAVGTQLKIATGSTKYDCNPCAVSAIVSATQFTYIGASGNQAAPATPYAASIYSNFVTVSSTAHGLTVGQTVTLSACTAYVALNNTIATVSSVTNANTFVLATATSLTAGTDTCKYTPNTATVTTATPHGFPSGALTTIAGATPAGYNGSWVVTATGATTFTYQYTMPAPLTSPAVLAAATASSSATSRDTLTRWVRGEDNYGDEASLCPPGSTPGVGNCPNPAVNIRPSVHGDVLHSRPVVINYGGATVTITGTADSGTVRTATAPDTTPIGVVGSTADVTFANGATCQVTVASSTTFTYPVKGCGIAGAQTAATASPNVMVFYGGNDGVFRAANGNQVNPPSSTLPSPGAELWGFVPPEFFGKLKRLHDNSPALLMPSTLPGIIPTPQRKDYFVDGSTGVYQLIDGVGRTTKAYLYLVMRRGARLIYALDVTDPKNPKFLWKHSNTDAGFSELGQTWSQPKVAIVKGYANPVLIFGAGYDATAEDAEPPTADTMGRGIFILDAVSGNLVWSACGTGCTLVVPGMAYSIPSDITLVDRNNDGKIDRLYVGDMGGNMWRVDLEPTGGNTPGLWQAEKLAALGCATGACAAGVTPRKIFYPPEVITTSGYDAVFTATGDREHPLYTNPASTASAPKPFSVSPPYGVSACAVTNRAYLLKDLATGMDGSGLTTITEQTGATAHLFDATATPWNGTLSGYYVTFNVCEKSVNAPLVTAGHIYFGTNQAKALQTETCEESLGEAVGYKLAPFSGKYVAGEFEGGGLPPSPVSGVVNIKDPATGKITQVPFCIGCGGEDENGGNTGCGSESALAGCKPPINVSTTRSRTYWYTKDK